MGIELLLVGVIIRTENFLIIYILDLIPFRNKQIQQLSTMLKPKNHFAVHNNISNPKIWLSSKIRSLKRRKSRISVAVGKPRYPLRADLYRPNEEERFIERKLDCLPDRRKSCFNET